MHLSAKQLITKHMTVAHMCVAHPPASTKAGLREGIGKLPCFATESDHCTGDGSICQIIMCLLHTPVGQRAGATHTLKTMTCAFSKAMLFSFRPHRPL